MAEAQRQQEPARCEPADYLAGALMADAAHNDSHTAAPGAIGRYEAGYSGAALPPACARKNFIPGAPNCVDVCLAHLTLREGAKLFDL